MFNENDIIFRCWNPAQTVWPCARRLRHGAAAFPLPAGQARASMSPSRIFRILAVSLVRGLNQGPPLATGLACSSHSPVRAIRAICRLRPVGPALLRGPSRPSIPETRLPALAGNHTFSLVPVIAFKCACCWITNCIFELLDLSGVIQGVICNVSDPVKVIYNKKNEHFLSFRNTWGDAIHWYWAEQ
jgi:hypothetical protein